MIRCSGILPDKKGKFQSKWPEYETLWCFGPHSGISDLDAISKYDYMCDDIGVDTIDVGVAVGVAMAGGGIPYGDTKAVLEVMNGISEGTPIGRVIGCGAATAGRVFGVRRVPTVKGQSLPAYDPRAVKGQGVTYATTPMDMPADTGYPGTPTTGLPSTTASTVGLPGITEMPCVTTVPIPSSTWAVKS